MNAQQISDYKSKLTKTSSLFPNRSFNEQLNLINELLQNQDFEGVELLVQVLVEENPQPSHEVRNAIINALFINYNDMATAEELSLWHYSFRIDYILRTIKNAVTKLVEVAADQKSVEAAESAANFLILLKDFIVDAAKKSNKLINTPHDDYNKLSISSEVDLATNKEEYQQAIFLLSLARYIKDLQSSVLREALFSWVLENDIPFLFDLLKYSKLLPLSSQRRALFLFLSGQWEAYNHLDHNYSEIITSYRLASQELRDRIIEKAREDGWGELAQFLIQAQSLANLSSDEWLTIIEEYRKGNGWDELRNLALKAPPVWSQYIFLRWPGNITLPDAQINLPQLSLNCSKVGPALGSLLRAPTTTLFRVSTQVGSTKDKTFEVASSNFFSSSTFDPSNLPQEEIYSDQFFLAPNGCWFTVYGMFGDNTFKVGELSYNNFSTEISYIVDANINVIYGSASKAFAFSHDGRMLAYANYLTKRARDDDNYGPSSYDNQFYLLKSQTGEILSYLPLPQTLTKEQKEGPIKFAFSKDKKTLVGFCSDLVFFWDVTEDGKTSLRKNSTITLPKPLTYPEDAVVDENCHIFVCLFHKNDKKEEQYHSRQQDLFIWRLPDSHCQRIELDPSVIDVKSITMSPNGKELAIVASRGFEKVTPDGVTLAPGSAYNVEKKFLFFWDIEQNKITHNSLRSFSTWSRVFFSPDSQYLLFAGRTKRTETYSAILMDLRHNRSLELFSQSAPFQLPATFSFVPTGEIRGIREGNLGPTNLFSWASRLTQLCGTPTEQMTLQDLEWVQDQLGSNADLWASERAWLHFIEALVIIKFQGEIELGEVTHEFNLTDIELDNSGDK